MLPWTLFERIYRVFFCFFFYGMDSFFCFVVIEKYILACDHISWKRSWEIFMQNNWPSKMDPYKLQVIEVPNYGWSTWTYAWFVALQVFIKMVLSSMFWVLTSCASVPAQKLSVPRICFWLSKVVGVFLISWLLLLFNFFLFGCILKLYIFFIF
jgi:hypothetical protein